MKIEVYPLLKLSICPCGYGVLVDSIQLGVKYRLNVDSIRGGFRYRCGRCGKTQDPVEVVDASQILNPDAPMRPLPAPLFGLQMKGETQ